MCEMAMSYVKSMLAKNATEEQIMQTLMKACHYLSSDLAQQVRQDLNLCITTTLTASPFIYRTI